MSADLVFSSAQLYSPNLVFGDEGGAPPATDVVLSVVAVLPRLRGTVLTRVGVPMSAVGALPKLRGTVGVRYESNTDRPTVGEVLTRFQQGVPGEDGVAPSWQETAPLRVPLAAVYQEAVGLQSGVAPEWTDADRTDSYAGVRFQQAANISVGAVPRWQEGRRTDAYAASRFQYAERSITGAAIRFQEAFRDRRNWAASRFQDAVPVSTHTETFEGYGVPLIVGKVSRYQEARRPPAGIWVKPVVPPEHGCYTPSPELVFCGKPSGPFLLFSCECEPGQPTGETIVVPVQRVYVVVNSATLTRVSDGGVIPTTSMTMSLDVDSWTWSFSASVPGAALALVSRVAGEPVEVLATLNGVPYHFIVEQVSRERTFGSSSLRVSGRGRAAFLDAPYAPMQSFINSEDRTAQQLMGDVLTINGVPLGWGINWTPTDWTVPAGVFAHQGSMMSALTTIAASTGAYIRPHPVNQELDVLLKYPVAPWEWGAVTPDYELPSAVVTKEGVEWLEKAEYNRVYVGGASVGVFGPVTRAGTDGELVAQTVTDALITSAAPHRQRGITVLSDTGRQEKVTLSLPVLAETGIIPPGKFVRYVDGATTRLGLTRAVSVSLGQSAVDLRQEIVLETHL